MSEASEALCLTRPEVAVGNEEGCAHVEEFRLEKTDFLSLPKTQGFDTRVLVGKVVRLLRGILKTGR